MTAQTDASVVVYGESGTGKELAAQRIHELSKRATNARTVNCGRSPTPLERNSDKRGAFTDAHRDTPGLVEEAAERLSRRDRRDFGGGASQASALSSIKEYKPWPAASQTADGHCHRHHRDLKDMVRDGRFREDLYYRLNIVPITVPRCARARTFLARVPLLSASRTMAAKKCAGLRPRSALCRPRLAGQCARTRKQGPTPRDTQAISFVRLTISRAKPRSARAQRGSFKEEKRKLLDDFERELVVRC